MKKAIPIVAVLVVIALLPLLGNKVIQDTIESRFATLKTFGLSIRKIREKKEYLHTYLSYAVTVENEKKFLLYLQQFSSKQLPPYTQSLLEGVEFGIDLSYSNIPLSEKIAIDIYPKRLSSTMMEELQTQAPELFDFIEDILRNKRLLYHVEYAVVTGEFEGKVKDFDQTVTMPQAQKLHVKFSGVTMNGKGMLLAPEMLQSGVDSFDVFMQAGEDSVRFRLKGLATTSNFDSETTYAYSVRVAEIQGDLKDSTGQNDFSFYAKEAFVDTSSNTQKKAAELFFKVAFDKVTLRSRSRTYDLEGGRLNASIENLQKEGYEKIVDLFEDASMNSRVDPAMEQELRSAVLAILSHGFSIKIPELSLEALQMPSAQKIKGFDAKLDLRLDADSELEKKLRQNPSSILQNARLQADIRLSERLYALINDIYPLELMMHTYKRVENKSVRFVIRFEDATLTINGKKVQ